MIEHSVKIRCCFMRIISFEIGLFETERKSIFVVLFSVVNTVHEKDGEIKPLFST